MDEDRSARGGGGGDQGAETGCPGLIISRACIDGCWQCFRKNVEEDDNNSELASKNGGEFGKMHLAALGAVLLRN